MKLSPGMPCEDVGLLSSTRRSRCSYCECCLLGEAEFKSALLPRSFICADSVYYPLDPDTTYTLPLVPFFRFDFLSKRLITLDCPGVDSGSSVFSPEASVKPTGLSSNFSWIVCAFGSNISFRRCGDASLRFCTTLFCYLFSSPCRSSVSWKASQRACFPSSRICSEVFS